MNAQRTAVAGFSGVGYSFSRWQVEVAIDKFDGEFVPQLEQPGGIAEAVHTFQRIRETYSADDTVVVADLEPGASFLVFEKLTERQLMLTQDNSAFLAHVRLIPVKAE